MYFQEENMNLMNNKVTERISVFLKKCGIPDMFLVRFAGLYFIVSGINLILAKSDDQNAVTMWKEFIADSSFTANMLWVALGFVLLSVFHYFTEKKFHIADALTLFSGVLLFSLSLMWRNDNYYLCIGVAAVAVVFISYLMGKIDHGRFEKLPSWAAGAIVFTTAAVVTIFVSVTTIAKHRCFGTSCFDFGIFVQMFHSMAEDLTAVTSCERDKLLSHFYVHASYIYYALVPFYALFPNENTLFIAQAILSMGGVIPLFLLAKKHKYEGLSLVAACMIYIFYSGLVAPCYYDFHENAFLPTILMWLLYAMDQRKMVLFYLMSVLVCIVKEDAPLYVICIALFFLFDEKTVKRFHGVIITCLAVVYFILITNWLTEYGDGQMMTSSRLGDLTIDPEAGFGGIVKNVLVNPSYFFSLFVQEQTLLFFLQTMIPLIFLPFMTKKIHRFMLIIPYVIMNLVIGAGYRYAADIGYQYIFGPSCLLIYMAILNCKDMERERRNTLATVSAVVSMITVFSLVSGRISHFENYRDKKDYYRNLEACLDTVPRDAAVISNTWFLPHIADRKEVYIFDKNDFVKEGEDTYTALKDMDRYDFYVLSRRDENTNLAIPYLEEAGYTVFNETENFIVIYVSPDYQFAE